MSQHEVDRAAERSSRRQGSFKADESLRRKRERFEEAGAFPFKKLALVGTAVFLLMFGAVWGYQSWKASQAVGGVQLLPSVEYPEAKIKMTAVEDIRVTEEGVSFPAALVRENFMVSFVYDRETPMPAGYQQAAGGNVLPMLAYVAPNGRLVVATSFCEPCRSTGFTIDGSQLVCDVCFTRWDLNTLLGIGGGCVDYPPEEVTAELRGDEIFVPSAELESWTPRAYQ